MNENPAGNPNLSVNETNLRKRRRLVHFVDWLVRPPHRNFWGEFTEGRAPSETPDA